MYHGHLCPGPRRHVRELERHVAAADKENPRGEGVELEELIAGRQVLAARELLSQSSNSSSIHAVMSFRAGPARRDTGIPGSAVFSAKYRHHMTLHRQLLHLSGSRPATS